MINYILVVMVLYIYNIYCPIPIQLSANFQFAKLRVAEKLKTLPKFSTYSETFKGS